MAYGGPFEMTVAGKKNNIALGNILIGMFGFAVVNRIWNGCLRM
jgi:hypothetical protein